MRASLVRGTLVGAAIALYAGWGVGALWLGLFLAVGIVAVVLVASRPGGRK